MRISWAKNNPAGTATIELVLSMPILLAIIVGIVWLGSSVIAQTHVTVEARHKTWSQRDQTNENALVFLQDDIVSQQVAQTVNVSAFFDDASPAESKHDVMAGAWDYETLKLNEAPNWQLYARAALNAKTASIQNNYVDASNKLTQFKNAAGNIWRSLATNLIRELTSLGDSVGSFLKLGQDAEEAKKSQQRQQINRDLATKKRELASAENELRNLDDDATDALKDVLKNRVERLEAEVENLESDLEAIDG